MCLEKAYTSWNDWNFQNSEKNESFWVINIENIINAKLMEFKMFFLKLNMKESHEYQHVIYSF